MAKVTQTVYEIIPPGLYKAKVLDIIETVGMFVNEKTKEVEPTPQFEWHVYIEDQCTLKTWSSQIFSEKSKLWKWAAAILGVKTFPEGYVLNTDDLLDKELMASVIITPGKSGSGEFNKVDALLPMPKVTPRPTRVSPAAAKMTTELPVTAPMPDAPPWEEAEVQVAPAA